MKKLPKSGREEVGVVVDADFLAEPTRVGSLFYSIGRGDGVFSFAYDQEWLKHGSAFQIDPQLQLHISEVYPAASHSTFPIFLDSAPDRWGRILLDRREVLRARDEGRRLRVLTEWDYLLGVHDTCRIGGLRFRRRDNGAYLDDDLAMAAPPIASLAELEAASLALEDPDAADKSGFRKWLSALLAPGSSLGGSRPKANFTDRGGTLWIAKFPSRDDRRDVGAWEMVVQRLASAAGVDVPEAACRRLAGKYHTYCCRRFDRTNVGRRRFFVSAMTLLGRRDGDGGSYLELAEFLATRGTAKDRASDLRQLWRRVVFNILVSNTDDHLRNHGFIMQSDGWRLAPAYDVNPSVAKSVHALCIDDRDASPDLRLALSTARFYSLKPAEASRIAAAVREVVAGWRKQAIAMKIPRSEIELMEPAFRTEE